MPMITGETPRIDSKNGAPKRRDTEPNPILRRAADEVLKDLFFVGRDAAVSSLATLIDGIARNHAVKKRELAIVMGDTAANHPSKLDPKLLEIWKRYELSAYDLVPNENRTLSDLALTDRNKAFLDQVISDLGARPASIVQNAIDFAAKRYQGDVARKYRVNEDDLDRVVKKRIQDNKQVLARQRSKTIV